MKRVFALLVAIFVVCNKLDSLGKAKENLEFIPMATKYQVDQYPSKKIKIAIIDLNVNANEKLIKPFVENPSQYKHSDSINKPHANEVASVIAYHLNQVYGSQASELFEFRFFEVEFKDGKMTDSVYLQQLENAVNWKPDIINISSSTYTENILEKVLIIKARLYNIMIVTSAGNDKNSDPTYPCAFKGVLCVGAKNEFSNYGNHVSILVKQSEFKIRNHSGKVYKNPGTSFAAPFVTAYLASILVNMKSEEYFKPLIEQHDGTQIKLRTTASTY